MSELSLRSGVTAMFYLTPPRHLSTLPVSGRPPITLNLWVHGLAEVNRLLGQPNGATLAEINKATNQNAWSYKTNGTHLAKRYCGTYGTNDNTGPERRFWIK
jgi:hypothetical protein